MEAGSGQEARIHFPLFEQVQTAHAQCHGQGARYYEKRDWGRNHPFLDQEALRQRIRVSLELFLFVPEVAAGPAHRAGDARHRRELAAAAHRLDGRRRHAGLGTARAVHLRPVRAGGSAAGGGRGAAPHLGGGGQAGTRRPFGGTLQRVPRSVLFILLIS